MVIQLTVHDDRQTSGTVRVLWRVAYGTHGPYCGVVHNQPHYRLVDSVIRGNKRSERSQRRLPFDDVTSAVSTQ